MCSARNFPCTRIGVVDSGLAQDGGDPGAADGEARDSGDARDGGEAQDGGHEAGTQLLEVGDLFTLTLDELRAAHTATFPALFG